MKWLVRIQGYGHTQIVGENVLNFENFEKMFTDAVAELIPGGCVLVKDVAFESTVETLCILE